MKLSLTWIFDHIEGDWLSHDAHHIVTLFNQKTAEIEHVQNITLPIDSFFAAQSTTPSGAVSFIPELKKEISMPERSIEIRHKQLERYTFLVKKNGSTFSWVTLADFGVDKGGLLPALDITDADISGSWRSLFAEKDVILEVDNKSITHRPDMWGHRGFAREIAAFLQLPLKPKEDFLQTLPVTRYEHTSQPSKTMPFIIKNEAPTLCSAFNGLFISSYDNKPSNPLLASRLMMVGSRPMSSIIDITNYLTLDWGQPVHAYDAARIDNKKVIIRNAKDGEKLHLLDGDEITLSHEDLVIADGTKPMCLAGVKGGRNDSVSAATSSIFFEAAHFEPTTVRKSALHHKTRTDSSARFEKTLDPNTALEATFRCIALLNQCNMNASYSDHVVALGKEVKPTLVEITHEFIEKRSGITLSSDDIVTMLSRLEFNVTIKYTEPLTYEVEIPTFRSSKDIKIKEDILEEIIRSYGFNNIPLTLPPMQRQPFSTQKLQRKRSIRQYLAHGVGMMEQRNYALFDETFMTSLGLNPEHTINIINPVSENFFRLVTSLIPNLLKNISDNIVHQDSLAYFELGRTWEKTKLEPIEQQRVAGIFFEKRKTYDFYLGKHHVCKLIKALGFSSPIEWKKSTQQKNSWNHMYQTADIFYEDRLIGSAGMVNPLMLDRINGLPESSAFIFDLDASFLTTQNLDAIQYKAPSRYQETFFDVSLVVPITVTCDTIKNSLASISPLVIDVSLIDFYEDQSQQNTRFLTFRVWLQHMDHTLEKDEIDTVYQAALETISACGASIRS